MLRSAALLAGLAVLVAGYIGSSLNACGQPQPELTISGPFTHANLTIFLIHGKDTVSGRKLLTLQEALEQKKVVVHETSNVNELSVENVADDVDVFIQSGDIVKGGRQDRLLAVDMIVGPKSGKMPIPSFCCEAGRWQKRGAENAAAFDASVAQAGNKDVKLAVNATRRQDQVWAKVKEAQMKLGKNVGKSVENAASPSSYQLTLEDKDLLEKLSAYEKALSKALEGKKDVIGFALAVNGKVEGAEVYGSADLFAKLAPKLLKAAAIDALSELDKEKKFEPATAEHVKKFMAAAAQGKKTEVALRHEANRDAQSNRANQAAQAPTPQAPAPPAGTAPAKQAPVRVFQYDSEKIVLIECQDRAKERLVIHRSYIAK
jgi:hypothetical protein